MDNPTPGSAAPRPWLCWFGALALLLGSLSGQDLASAVARAQSLVTEAKKAERKAAAQLIVEALDVLEGADGVADSGDASYWCWMLALEARRIEEWRQAERAWRLAENYYARFPGDKDVYLLAARSGLAEALAQQNANAKVREALKLQRQVLDGHIKHSGADSDAALNARREVATTLTRLAEHAAALPEWLALEQADLARGDDFNLHWTRVNLSDVYERTQKHERVLEVAQSMIDRAKELFPVGSEERLQRLVDALHSHYDIGLYDEARTLTEAALREYRTVAKEKYRDSPAYWLGLHEVGLCLRRTGDFAGALAVYDEYFELVLSGNPDSVSLALAANEATTNRMVLGDYRGARELGERILARLPGNVLGWNNLFVLQDQVAEAALQSGDLVRAGEALHANLSKLQELFPDPEDQQRAAWFPRAWDGLSGWNFENGDLEQARHFAEMVRGHTLPAVYYKSSAAFTLALIDHRTKATPETTATLLSAYETWDELAWLPGRRSARKQLLFALDPVSNRQQVDDVLLAGLRDAMGQMEESLFLADRERAEVLGRVRPDVDWALSLGSAKQTLLHRLAFEVMETRRAAAMAMSGLSLQRRDPALEGKLREYGAVRERLGETVPLGKGDRPRISSTRMQQLRLQRDRLQREIRAELTQLGTGAVKVTASEVASRLRRRQREVAVGFSRYSHWTHDAKTLHRPGVEDRFVAHVVLPGDDTVHRVELGAADAIEQAIVAWRASIGAPVDRGRPVGGGDDKVGSRGEALRKLVFDPLRPLLDQAKAKTIYVCLDDALHLLPFDALPLGKKPLGDAYSIHVLPSFQALIHPLPKLVNAPPSLLALGGVDFAGSATQMAIATLATRRGGEQPFDFERLPFTTQEVVKIADYFEATFKKTPMLLRGADAHKAALVEKAPQARFLHIATHGWFAPPEVRSLADPVGNDVAGASYGHSPLALVGLALAGANKGRDADGRLPGILTAEHVAGLDLRGCEIAVLSACQTNVGLRRGGQSIQSLQTALHAAGARYAITSLWRVPDALTEQLMVRFYRNLWEKKQTPAKALWNAKTWLHEQHGAGLQHWAAWVLTSQ